MGVSEGVGDALVEEKNRFLFLVLFEGFHGAGKHEVGVSGNICPRESISVLGDLFPNNLPGYFFGNIRKPCLANTSSKVVLPTPGPPVMIKKLGLYIIKYNVYLNYSLSE